VSSIFLCEKVAFDDGARPNERRTGGMNMDDKTVELEFAESVSHMTVQQALKNELKPHFSRYWKIPPEGNAAFVVYMEDVLEIYPVPYDPD